MSAIFELRAELRADVGKGASRRLRREKKLIPAILYGANQSPLMLAFNENEVNKAIQFEAFFSHILTLDIAGKKEKVIIKDMHRHPAKSNVMHMDFQRVSATEKLTMNVPLHYTGENKAPGLKDGGVIEHNITELAIKCLPEHLPEYIEVDLSQLMVGDSLHLSDIKLPAGVELAHAIEDDEHDHPIAGMQAARAVVEETPVSTTPVEVEATKQKDPSAAGQKKG